MEANVAIVGQAHRLPSGNWQPERFALQIIWLAAK
jgi:hypothetical protein